MTPIVRAGALVLALSLLPAALPSALPAQTAAVNLRAGTTGLAVGATVRVSDRFNARVDIPWLAYSMDGEQVVDDFTLDYTADADFLTFGALVDYHPFAGRFRLSAGAYTGRRDLSFTGRSAGPHTVGNVTYTADQIGGLAGTIGFGSAVAPYLGLGFGNPVAPDKRLGFTADLGILFIGSPTVTMSGDGMIGPTAEDAPVLQDNLDWIYAWPSLTLGLSIRAF